MAIIHVLTDEGVRLYSSIFVNFWHIDIINEVYQLLCARWTIITTSFLLQRFLKDSCNTKCISERLT